MSKMAEIVLGKKSDRCGQILKPSQELLLKIMRLTCRLCSSADWLSAVAFDYHWIEKIYKKFLFFTYPSRSTPNPPPNQSWKFSGKVRIEKTKQRNSEKKEGLSLSLWFSLDRINLQKPLLFHLSRALHTKPASKISSSNLEILRKSENRKNENWGNSEKRERTRDEITKTQSSQRSDEPRLTEGQTELRRNSVCLCAFAHSSWTLWPDSSNMLNENVNGREIYGL